MTDDQATADFRRWALERAVEESLQRYDLQSAYDRTARNYALKEWEW